MSTRTQVSVEGSDVFVYRHTDGYPSSMLPCLLPFVAAFHKSRGHDESYLPARLCQWIGNELDSSGPDYLSLGVDTVLHGDIEYLYFVTAAGAVEAYAVAFGSDSHLKPGKSPKGDKGFRCLGSFALDCDVPKAVKACERADASGKLVAL